MKILLIISFFVLQLQTCNSDKAEKETTPKYFVITFTEPMDSISALNKNNYFVRDKDKKIIEIKEVKFLKEFTSGDSDFPYKSKVVLIPTKNVLPGWYQIIIIDVMDLQGDTLKPNPTKIYAR